MPRERAPSRVGTRRLKAGVIEFTVSVSFRELADKQGPDLGKGPVPALVRRGKNGRRAEPLFSGAGGLGVGRNAALVAAVGEVLPVGVAGDGHDAVVDIAEVASGVVVTAPGGVVADVGAELL